MSDCRDAFLLRPARSFVTVWKVSIKTPMKSCMTKKEATMIMARKKKPVSGRLFAIGPLPAKHRSPPTITTQNSCENKFCLEKCGVFQGIQCGIKSELPFDVA